MILFSPHSNSPLAVSSSNVLTIELHIIIACVKLRKMNNSCNKQCSSVFNFQIIRTIILTFFFDLKKKFTDIRNHMQLEVSVVLSRTSIVLSQVYDIVPCVDPEMFCRGGVRGIFKFAMGGRGSEAYFRYIYQVNFRTSLDPRMLSHHPC